MHVRTAKQRKWTLFPTLMYFLFIFMPFKTMNNIIRALAGGFGARLEQQRFEVGKRLKK